MVDLFTAILSVDCMLAVIYWNISRKKCMKNMLENNPLWVVDIGASGGIDPRWEKSHYSYRGILFEPDPVPGHCRNLYSGTSYEAVG